MPLLFQAALLHVGQRFGGKLFAHFNQFDKTEKRLVEAMAFTYENLPNEPYLGLAIKESMVGQLNKRALSSQESLQLLVFHQGLEQSEELPCVTHVGEE